NYLVEGCDPCEGDQYAYSIQGIAVSDFITPHFYDTAAIPGTPYSYTGAVERPREMLPGGYISYIDTVADEWKQILWVDPNGAPTYRDLGPAPTQGNLRVWIDSRMAEPEILKSGLKTNVVTATKASNKSLFDYCKAHRHGLHEAARGRETRYHLT